MKNISYISGKYSSNFDRMSTRPAKDLTLKQGFSLPKNIHLDLLCPPTLDFEQRRDRTGNAGCACYSKRASTCGWLHPNTPTVGNLDHFDLQAEAYYLKNCARHKEETQKLG